MRETKYKKNIRKNIKEEKEEKRTKIGGKKKGEKMS